jgi:hypothetical protein
MRMLSVIWIFAGLMVGCASDRAPADSSSTSTTEAQRSDASGPDYNTITNDNQIMTLANPVEGKVVRAKPDLRFVVLDFSVHPLPQLGKRLSVYREGKKVGEVEITGPERRGNIVADLVKGEAREGDIVRP